jgi:lipoate-protein ligase B
VTAVDPPVAHRHLGRIAYADALALQNATWERVVAGEPDEVLLTLEHDPVVTIGRRGDAADLLVPEALLRARGVDVFRADRGGELTYHGPGQLVVYGIVHLQRRRIAVGDWVRGVAGAIADELAGAGIEARYDGDNPGLWASNGAKICAVGMRISKGVARHGAAVNLTTDLDAFTWIVPCGMPSARATSVAELTGEPPSIDAFGRAVVARLRARFSLPSPA